MDRRLIYPGEIPLVEDMLYAFKNAMIDKAALAEAVLGQGTQVSGLGVTALSNTAVAGYPFSVAVGRGFIFAYEETDPNAYGVLGADTATSILKTGINLSATNVAIAASAPATAGYAVNYLISAAFEEQDTGSASLPFYNPSAPTSPTLIAENGLRQQSVVFQVSGGSAAPVGSQVTPATPVGYVPIAVVTIYNGDSSVVSGRITTIATNLIKSLTRAAPKYLSVGGTTLLTDDNLNSTIEITPNTGIVVTLPSPVYCAGDGFTIFNASSVSQTLASAAGIFSGPGGNGSSTLAIQPHAFFGVKSDNVNWVVDERIGVPQKSHYAAFQTGTVPVGDNAAYDVSSVTIVFPSYSRSGAFRIFAQMYAAGHFGAGNARQNITNALSDGTNSFQGAEWMVYGEVAGDGWVVGDALLTIATYAPGQNVTFTQIISSEGGDTSLTLTGCTMQLYVVEA